MDKQYAYEIYGPSDCGADIVGYIESDEPLLPIQRGDLLNPRTWDPHYAEIAYQSGGFKYGTILRVTGFEHFILESAGHVKHKVGVFTEAVEDLAENRP